MPPSTSPDQVSTLASVGPRDFVLYASDKYPLAARLWADTDCPSPVVAALINAGAGIGLRYYERFAQFLAGAGVPTLVYDYRGIGQSRPKSLRQFPASVEDWGSKDCAAALYWLAQAYPGAKRLVIGHSVGGFVTGFVTNGPMIDRMLLVGAHTGYWRDYAPMARPGLYLLWHAAMPVLTRLVGYFPGRMLHLVEDLPAGVALEWGNRRHPDFWLDRDIFGRRRRSTLWQESALCRFKSVHAETLAIRFTDDVFATAMATNRVLRLYQNCPATELVFSPADAGQRRIGHFGFFRSRFRDTLWMRVAEWLQEPQREQGAADLSDPTPPARPPAPSESP